MQKMIDESRPRVQTAQDTIDRIEAAADAQRSITLTWGEAQDVLDELAEAELARMMDAAIFEATLRDLGHIGDGIA